MVFRETIIKITDTQLSAYELAQTMPSRDRGRLCQHEQSKTQAQQEMVKDSLERAFNELHAGKVRKDARKLFK